MSNVKSYKDLVVWQKSMDLVVEVYEIIKLFPGSEEYILSSQIRRCAVSIPSNIAEGKSRGSRKDYRKFLIIAFASGSELETQIKIVKSLEFGKKLNFKKVDNLLNQTMKMLNKMISGLSPTT
jgi:four helix bundle protein